MSGWSECRRGATPAGPAQGWHTPGESANPTLALDPTECQQSISAQPESKPGRAKLVDFSHDRESIGNYGNRAGRGPGDDQDRGVGALRTQLPAEPGGVHRGAPLL